LWRISLFLFFLASPPSVPHISPPSPSIDLVPSIMMLSSHPSSLLSSPSSPASPSPPSPVVPSHPTIPFHYTRRPRVVTESSDGPSTSGASPQPTYSLCNWSHPSPDFYNPASYSIYGVPEPTTYREAIVHPEWQLAMAEDIAAFEHTGMW
jgi:hypothetical protein